MKDLLKSVSALFLIVSMLTMSACNAADKTVSDGDISNQSEMTSTQETESTGDSLQDEEITTARIAELEYEVNSDGVSCSIVGLGECKDTDIIVRESIAGYKVTSIGKAGVYPFKDCKNITSVTIADSVIEIFPKSFSGCTSLQHVKIPDSVEIIYSYVFENCSLLKDVELSKNLEYIDKFAFYGCSSMENIKIPESVNSIRSCAFGGCLSLESVYIPKTVEHIDSGAFSKCENLKTIVFDGTRAEWDSIDKGVGCFGEGAYVTATLVCYDGKYSIDVNGTVRDIFSSGLGYKTYESSVVGIGDCKDSFLRIPSTYNSSRITIIDSQAFAKNTKITGLKLEEGFKEIGRNAFYNCTNLKEVYLPTSLVGVSWRAFQGCKSLETVYMPGTGSIDGDAFKDCVSLKIVRMENIACVEEDAFKGCTSLTSVSFGTNLIKVYSYAFVYCSSLSQINYAGTSKEWKKLKHEENSFNTGGDENITLICSDGEFIIDVNGKILSKKQN